MERLNGSDVLQIKGKGDDFSCVYRGSKYIHVCTVDSYLYIYIENVEYNYKNFNYNKYMRHSISNLISITFPSYVRFFI